MAVAVIAAIVLQRDNLAHLAGRLDPSWAACLVSPTRACVIRRAFAEAREADDALGALFTSWVLITEAELNLPETVHDAKAVEAWLLQRPRDRRDAGWHAIATAYASVGAVDSARKILPNFASRDEGARAVDAIAAALYKQGKRKEAFDLVRTHPYTAGSYRDYSELLWFLQATMTTREEAMSLLPFAEEAEALVGASGVLCVTHDPYNSQCAHPLAIVALPLTRLGGSAEAIAAARRIKEEVARVEVLGQIGRVLTLAGRTDQALAVAAHDARPSERAAVLHRAVPTYEPQLGDQLTDKDAPAIAVAPDTVFASSMAAASAFATQEERDGAYALIACANARKGMIAQAVAAGAKIVGERYRLQAFIALGSALALAGATVDAVATFARAESEASRTRSAGFFLSHIAREMAKAGLIEEALGVVSRIAVLVKTGSAHDWDVEHARRGVAKAMARGGRVVEAINLARQNPSYGGDISESIEAVVSGCVDGGRIESALGLAKSLPEETRDWILKREGSRRARDGHAGQARLLATGIGNDADRAVLLAETSVGFSNEGRASEADAAAREALVASLFLLDAYERLSVLLPAARGLSR